MPETVPYGRSGEPAPAPGGKRRLSRGWLTFIIIIAVLLVLWIAIEIAVPRIASSYVRKELVKKYPQAQGVEVAIKAFPAIKLAFKQYSSLLVKVSGITLEGINFSSIELRSDRWPEGTFSAVVSPEEIMRFFTSSHSYVLSPSLSLASGKIQISGNMQIGPSTAAVVATGSLVPRTGKSIYFVPEDISVTGLRQTGQAVTTVKQIMDSNPVFVVRSDLPFTITSIAPSAGQLEVKGEVELEKALKVKL